MSNTISQNPLLAKTLLNADTANSEKQGLSELVRAQQGLKLEQGARPNTPDESSVTASPKGLMAAARMQQLERSYQYSETMSLSLTTQEGDQVTVDFRQLYSQYQSYRHEQAGASGPEGVRYFESKALLEETAFEERFGFSVTGDLNEDELKAVFDVFEQVDQLANNFYNGDIEKAMQQAMEMDVDFGQLKNVQLDLTQSQTATTRYQEVAMSEYETIEAQESTPKKDEQAEDYGVSMSDLPNYLQQWQMSIERLNEHFAKARNTFDDLMSATLAQRFPEQDNRPGWLERVQAFHEQLAEYAAQTRENETPAEDETNLENSAISDQEIEPKAVT